MGRDDEVVGQICDHYLAKPVRLLENRMTYDAMRPAKATYLNRYIDASRRSSRPSSSKQTEGPTKLLPRQYTLIALVREVCIGRSTCEDQLDRIQRRHDTRPSL
jgi:hypothetical protein